MPPTKKLQVKVKPGDKTKAYVARVEQAIAPKDPTQSIYADIERQLALGDFSRMTPEERLSWAYNMTKVLGLNPASSPIKFILDRQGLYKPYMSGDAADQLRRVHKVNTGIIEKGFLKDEKGEPTRIYTVWVKLWNQEGREGFNVGAVVFSGTPEDMANCPMKATTKALRRGTLSFVGLGAFLIEDELETMRGWSTAEGAKPSQAPAPMRIAPPQVPSLPPPSVQAPSTVVAIAAPVLKAEPPEVEVRGVQPTIATTAQASSFLAPPSPPTPAPKIPEVMIPRLKPR